MREAEGSAHIRSILALAVVLAALAAAPAAHAFVDAPGGPFLTDEQGRRLQLHGVNLVAKCGAQTSPSGTPGTPCLPDPAADEPAYVLAPEATDPGRRFTAADARTLRGLGFTTVRLGIIWEALEPGPPGAGPDDPRYCSRQTPGTPFPDLGADDPYDEAKLQAYLARVDRIVDLLAAEGIRVLIDMHQDAWGSAFGNSGSATPWVGEGAPRWATCTSGLPFRRPDGWQGAYQDAAVEAAFSHFFSNDVSGNLQGHFARVWAAVAKHFAGREEVIGYDLLNEPADPTLLATPEFDRRLACFYAGSMYAPASCVLANSQAPPAGLIPAVQAADPRHVVFYEAPLLTDFGAPDTVGVFEELPFPRLALSFHVYGVSAGTSPSFECSDPSCGPLEESTFAGFAQYRGATRTEQPGGPAWALTEFGAEDYVPDVARMAALADQHLVTWFYWAGLQLHDPTGGPTEGLVDEATRRPDPKRAAVLARAYARATAGTPVSQRFDPASGDFDYTYTPDPEVTAPTEVVLPLDWHYGYGYTASATGARITSRRDAGLLTLRNDPGAGVVTLQVRASRPRLPPLPPAARRCRDTRRFSFRIHQPRRGRIVRVDVYVNGHRALTRRGRRVTRVTLRRLPKRRFRVKVVARASSGQRTISVRTYRGCRKGRPRTRVRR